MRTVERVILHLDMDAFYAAVEVREDPSLAGKPLIIGHPGRRGVVSTCSYEARRFGVHSAMPSVTAKRLCPQATWKAGRMSLYVEISRRIKALLSDLSPAVEPLSIDEAFIDMTGICANLEDGVEAAREIKQRILDAERLSASVGVAPNKFLAKVASDLDKPDGLVLLSRESLPELLWPLSVRKLWGVGPKTAEQLQRGGIVRIGQILETDEASLAELVGPGSAAHLRALSRGDDNRPVVRGRRAKSVSEERTYSEDLFDPDEIDRALLARAEGVARQLRRDRLDARTLHLKVRTGDFTTWTRSLTLAEPTDLAEPLVEAARTLYRERGVRLLGLGVSGLQPVGQGQGRLFSDPDSRRARRMTRAADAVRERMGERSVVRARLLRRRAKKASSLPSVD
jgi:nucleotidyltransferase/DNA polymerase involved in DNA repair